MTSATPGLLIVWHSRTGASEQMASAAYRSACVAEPDLPVHIVRCEQVSASMMGAAGAYLFVCPENLASMSGAMKEFFDRNYYPLLDQVTGRPYACIVCAGSDGQGAVRQISTIATGWRLKPVQPAIIINTAAQSETQILARKVLSASDLSQGSDTGAALASGLAMGIF